MMYFAPIVPVSMLETIREYNYHMVLAQLGSIQEYFVFYKDHNGFKMLDNGAAEATRVDPEDLLKLAFQLQVDEVIAPDAYGDQGRTMMMLKQFKPVAENYHVMAVLQCRTWPEFDQILHLALSMNVASVALPRVMCASLGPAGRLAAAEIIRKESNIPIHALGCTPHLHEARDLARQGIVRGIDSSAPVVQGLVGRGMHDVYVERPHDFFAAQPTTQARKNLDTFRGWCDNPETPTR